MPYPRPVQLARLSQFSKTEILEALGRDCRAEPIAATMIALLEQKREREIIDRYDQAVDKEYEARRAFIEWQKEMCKIYGDGNTFKPWELPEAELKRGVEFEKAVRRASEEVRRLEEKI